MWDSFQNNPSWECVSKYRNRGYSIFEMNMTNYLISEVKNVYFISGKLPKWFVHCITRSNLLNFGNENFVASSKFNQIVALMPIRPSLNVIHICLHNFV